MKEIKMLNDNELEMVNGGSIESSNIVGYNEMPPSIHIELYNLNRVKE